MTLNRVRVLWQNFPGAPGYSNHYVSSAVTAQTEIRAFYDAVKGFLPAGLTIQVPSSGDQIDESNGTITGAWSGAAQALITATGSGNYPGSAGCCVNWKSNAVVAGRRPMGRTYLVPLTTGSFETNGSIAAATITAVTTAATTLITNLVDGLKVWNRPTETRAGGQATVLTAQVPDLAVVLRSRRI